MAGGNVKLEVFLQDETLWLTQKMMVQLFDVAVPTIINISKHLQRRRIKKKFNSSEIPNSSK